MDGSPIRFVAGREEERNANGVNPTTRGTTFGSSGVVSPRGTASGSGPGADGSWSHGLDFTPGALNPGQEIPTGWFLTPNGRNLWVYFSVAGDHISQSVGGETSRNILVIMPEGAVTNVVYSTMPWFEVATISVKGGGGSLTNEVHQRGEWTYPFTLPKGEQSAIISVVATEGADHRLDDKRIGLKDSPYRNAVLNWLQEMWPDRDADEIRLARFGGLTGPATKLMSLVDMYWLDICPFNSDGSPFELMDPKTSEWAFRGGFTFGPQRVSREVAPYGKLSNILFGVKMVITNEFDGMFGAPYTLQGLNNELSALDIYQGGWTGVSLKILGSQYVDGGTARNGGDYLPFREFIFNEYSFDENCESTIELIDPFSPATPAGAAYEWWRNPEARDNQLFLKWTISSTNNLPTSVEMLKADSSCSD